MKMKNQQQRKIQEFSPAFFEILIGGRLPNQDYVQPADSSSPTRGWKQLAPRNISDRRILRDKCGDDCFLMPGELKFPICSKEMDCKPNCSGILAAKVRANQWDYPIVAEKADRLYRENCSLSKS